MQAGKQGVAAQGQFRLSGRQETPKKKTFSHLSHLTVGKSWSGRRKH
jgi:hypothetical protein